MAELGLGSKRLNPKKMDTAPAMEALKKRFGVGGELIETYYHPYIYLNREVIAGKGSRPDGRSRRPSPPRLMKFDGIALALSSTALREGGVPNAPLVEQIQAQLPPQALRRRLRRPGALLVPLRGGNDPHLRHSRLALAVRHLSCPSSSPAPA